MDCTIIRAALGALEHELGQAREARHQMEAEAFGYRHSGGWEEPAAVLPYYLNRAYDMMLVVLEAAALPETRRHLLEMWSKFESAGGIGKVRSDAEYDSLTSEPLDYLETQIAALRASVGEPMLSADAFELSKFEALLRDTAVLVHRRHVTPRRELDVQNVMHDYLEACFPQYRHPVEIAGVIRTFKPDGGVRNLRAAVEFKFAGTSAEVRTALSGVFEDVAGYSGSLDWTQFYTVVYQTKPYESEGRFKAEMARAGALSWTPIVVTGGGSRESRTAVKAGAQSSDRAARCGPLGE
jgi:hypothetical protein